MLSNEEAKQKLDQAEAYFEGHKLPILPVFDWNYSTICQEIDPETNTGIGWTVRIARWTTDGWKTRDGKGDSPMQAALEALSSYNNKRVGNVE